MTTLQEDLKALRDALDAGPTDGEWRWVDESPVSTDLPELVSDSGSICHFGNSERYYPTEGSPPSPADSDYIAAANPARIARLLAAVETTRDALKLTLHAVCLAGWEGDLSAEMARAALAQFEEKTK